MKYCVAIGMALSDTIPVPLGGDFIEQMYIAKNIGYDCVELHIPHPSVLDIVQIQTEMERLGLEIATLGTGSILGRFGFSLVDEDALKRQFLVTMLKEFIDCASVLGSKVTIGSIKDNVKLGKEAQQSFDLLGSTLQDLCHYAGERGVTLLLEATNRYENNLLNRGEEVVKIIKQFSLNNAQLLLDTFHCNIEESSIHSCLEPLAEQLGHVHFADTNRWYPGAGSFPFDRFISQLKAIGYDGVVSIECLPKPTGLEAAHKAYEFLRSAFA